MEKDKKYYMSLNYPIQIEKVDDAKRRMGNNAMIDFFDK